MELYLQFAHGMKQLSIDLAKDWGGSTVILSPRDMTPTQLERWTNSFKKANIRTLFDPQCYYPKSNHKNLVQYEYWDDKFGTKLGGTSNFEEHLIESIYEYNKIAGTSDFIIPSMMFSYDEEWLKRWNRNNLKLIKATKKIVKNKRHILTITLPEAFLLQREEEIEKVIKIAEKYDVDGYYIIASPPREKYLVDEPIWLVNLMQLCGGLKLQEKKVIMGYGNHQLLCLTMAGVDAMATGTYLNVRRFTNKFEVNTSIKRKSVWYYYPAALSEYKLGFLDMAFNYNLLESMKPNKEMDNGYVEILFKGALPSSTKFTETMAFKHYLNCIRIQMKNLSKLTFRETVDSYELLLETATRRIESLESNGIYAQTRSFKDIVDVNKSAIQRLNKNLGFQLSREWSNLQS